MGMQSRLVGDNNDKVTAMLDSLVQRFFAAFDNTGGNTDLSVLHDMFLPEAIIINNTNQPAAVYAPTTFIPPRQEMFDTDVLENFKEWEIEADTVVIGRVAHRRSMYGKSGKIRGVTADCVGHKSFQFVQTESGWKISALSWWDEDTAP